MDNKNVLFELAKDEDLDLIVKLFDNENFCFMTTYPTWVPVDELYIYCIKQGNTFKVLYNNNIIGLLQIYAYSGKDIHFKYRLVKYTQEQYKAVLDCSIKMITEKHQEVEKMSTFIYGFDSFEIEFFKNSNMQFEYSKRNDIFKDGKFWDIHFYRLLVKK